MGNKWSQQERCKRCEGSVNLKGWAQCKRMRLCLFFDDGEVRRFSDDQRIVCDGKDWQYAEVAEKEGGER